jgi:DNA polymerase-3 subunit gamma/tau
MLLKGLGEVQSAPSPLQAAEMVVIRLTHAADLPTPVDLVRHLQDGGGAPADRPRSPVAAERPPPTTTAFGAAPAPAMRDEPSDRPRAFATGGAVATAQTEAAVLAPNPESFAAIVTLLGERREAILQAHLKNNVHLVRFEQGRLEFRPDEHAPRTLANRLGALLSEWTGRRWVVAISSEPGEPTLAEQEAATDRRERAEVTAHPLVQAVMTAFPGATIEAIRDLATATEPTIDGEPEA